MSRHTAAPKAAPKRAKTVKTVRKAARAPAHAAARAPARKKPAAAEKKAAVVRGGVNVFADLGFPNADELLLKSGLLMPVTESVQKLKQKMTQKEIAGLLGVSQPDVSRLIAGGFLHKYSVGRLIKMLAALGHDVDIVIHTPRRAPRRGRRAGRIAVKVQAA